MLYLQSAVPGTRAQCHAVRANAQARYTVLVTGEDTHTLALQSIPDVACPVIVAAEEDATRDRERHRCDTAQDVVMRVRVQLAVRADIKQAARSIVRARGESVAVGEESARQV